MGRIIGVIPARMASSRFPGKPMAEINGIPMIGHVYTRSKKSSLMDEVYVATCDQDIADYIQSINGIAVMTSDAHNRASTRVAEAMEKIEKDTGETTDILVMIQGDEPMIEPGMIDEAVKPFLDEPDVQVVNLMSKIKAREEQDDPNEVKVVFDNNSDAVYFSRESIPSRKKHDGAIDVWKQVCIIPFRRDYLIKYNDMPETPLEIIESVDMLRVIETGGKVRMVPTKYDTYSVDTPEDLKRVEALMR